MIRLLNLTVAAAGLALFSTLPGRAQSVPFYLKTGIGAAITQDTDLKEFNGPVTGTKVKFDTGFQMRFEAGWQINDWLATELETGFTYNNIRSITGASYVDASLSNVPFLANLVLHPSPRWLRFAPYIGGGPGVSTAFLDSHDININGLHLSDTQATAVFAYHGFAGLRYSLNPHMGVSVEYRYFATLEPTWQSDVAFGAGTGRTRFGENQTHSVLAAFTWNF